MNISKSNKMLPILFIISLLSYLYPLTNYKTNIAGLSGDPYSHAFGVKWFCENFFKFHFHVKQFFSPIGVDFASSYDMPLLNTVACIAHPLGPFFMLNIIAIIQVGLIVISSWLVSQKYISNYLYRWSFILLLSFTGFYLTRIEGHLNLLSTIWGVTLTFYYFYDIDLTDLKKTITSFVILAIIFLSGWQNIANLTFLVIIFLVNSLIKAKQTKKLTKSIKNTTFCSIIFLLIVLPFVFPIFSGYAQGKTNKDLTGIYTYNADLFSYIIPSSRNLLRPIFNTIVNNIEGKRGVVYFELINPIDIGILLISVVILLKYAVQRNLASLIKGRKLLVSIFLFYTLLSFGPYISIAGYRIVGLPYYKFFYMVPPLSLTRTPARIGIVAVFFFYFIFFQIIQKNKSKHFAKFLLIYVIFSTIFINNNYRYVTSDYKKLLPLAGLNIIKNDREDVNVLNIPIALLNDPTQDLLLLYHNKNLISGYVSYAAVNSDTLQTINNNFALKNLDCSLTETYDVVSDTYNHRRILSNVFDLVDNLKKANIKYIILNKEYIKNKQDCSNIEKLYINIKKSPNFFQLIDENDYFGIYSVINKTEEGSNSNIYISFDNSWTQPWGSKEQIARWSMNKYNQIWIYSSINQNIEMSFHLFILDKNRLRKISINSSDYNINRDDEINMKLTLMKGANTINFSSDYCDRPTSLDLNSKDNSCYYFGIRQVDLQIVKDIYE